MSVLSVFICYDGITGTGSCEKEPYAVCADRRGQELNEEVRVIERDEVEQLKQILLSIARADASEALLWSAKQARGESDAVLSAELSRSVSSLKVKQVKDGLECELKLYDKLKAIELYFKLCGIGDTATDGALYIDYDYTSPDENED